MKSTNIRIGEFIAPPCHMQGVSFLGNKSFADIGFARIGQPVSNLVIFAGKAVISSSPSCNAPDQFIQGRFRFRTRYKFLIDRLYPEVLIYGCAQFYPHGNPTAQRPVNVLFGALFLRAIPSARVAL